MKKQHEQILALKDKIFYRIVYFDPPERYSKNINDVDKMVGSFKFINASGLQDLVPK